MADYVKRVKTKVIYEYTLRTPTNWVEISKVLAGIKQDSPTSTSDDAWLVRTTDEEIIFYREVDS